MYTNKASESNIGTIVISGLAVVGMFFAGIGFGTSDYQPRSLQVRDLNGDSKPDVIVESRKRRDIYIQQEDGTYKNIYQIQQSERESIEQKLEKTE